MMAVLNFLFDNSNIFVISMLSTIAFFFIHLRSYWCGGTWEIKTLTGSEKEYYLNLCFWISVGVPSLVTDTKKQTKKRIHTAK